MSLSKIGKAYVFQTIHLIVFEAGISYVLLFVVAVTKEAPRAKMHELIFSTPTGGSSMVLHTIKYYIVIHSIKQP